MQFKIIQLSLVGFLISYCELYSQSIESNVYMVVIPRTANHSQSIQTGFKINGTKGIVTCLHGLSDVSTVSAFNSAGDVLRGLSIKYVDVKNDLALLQSMELINGRNNGLYKSQSLPLSSQKLKVLGHPDGININEKTVYVGTPILKLLSELIPPSMAAAFNKRNSPSPTSDVLYLEGNLVPGHSGAPLLDENNTVYGIIDGGLRGGAAGISWAIPILSIRWQKLGLVIGSVKDLSKTEINNLFSFQEYSEIDNAPIIVSKDEDGNDKSIQSAIDNAPDGSTIIIKPGIYFEEVKLKHDSVSLKIKGDGKREDIVIQSISNYYYLPNLELDISNITVNDGLYIDGNLILRNSIIKGSRCALKLGKFSDISNCEISANLKNGNAWGVLVGESTRFKNCIFANNQVGIFFHLNDSYVEASRCTFVNNGTGIYLGGNNSTLNENDCNYSGNNININGQGTVNGKRIE